VDALGLVGQFLDRMIKGTMIKGTAPRAPKTETRDGYARLFDEAYDEGGASWKTV
jgi:hypothetical protein